MLERTFCDPQKAIFKLLVMNHCFKSYTLNLFEYSAPFFNENWYKIL